MSKKIILALVLVLLSGVALLWLVGGSEGVEEYRAANTGNIWRVAALATAAESKKGAPLLTAAPEEVRTTAVPQIAASAITASTKDDAATLATYANNYRLILTTFATGKTSHEAEEFLTFLQTGDRAALDKVTIAYTNTATARDALTKLTIPPSARAVHTELLITLGTLANLLHSMERVESEPMVSLSSARVYTESYLKFVQSLLAINKYFIEHGATFTGPAPVVPINP